MLKMLSNECIYCQDSYIPNLGLDRINNFIGHLKSNCVTCCYECNTARSNLYTFEEMKTIGVAIKEIKSRRNFKMHGVVIPLSA